MNHENKCTMKETTITIWFFKWFANCIKILCLQSRLALVSNEWNKDLKSRSLLCCTLYNLECKGTEVWAGIKCKSRKHSSICSLRSVLQLLNFTASANLVNKCNWYSKLLEHSNTDQSLIAVVEQLEHTIIWIANKILQSQIRIWTVGHF
jgi:hypothetical protein